MKRLLTLLEAKEIVMARKKGTKLTIDDIARLSDVSRSTVSRVLANSPNVNPQTREKIQSIILDNDYRPNSLARGLVHGAIKIVALIVGDIRNPFYSNLIWHAEQILHENGYMTLLCNSNYEVDKVDEFLSTAVEYGYAGVITVSIENNEVIANHLNNMPCPVVLLNRYLPSFNGDVVVTDNFTGGYSATKHLIELGHTKIGFLKGPDNSTVTHDRFSGFTKAMNNFNIAVDPKYVAGGDLDMTSGYNFGMYLVSLDQEAPSAVIAGNDLMALGIMNALKQSHLRIPEDISLVGFDDIPMAALSGIDLTTVKQPIKDLGETAANLIIERLKGETPTRRKKILFDPELIIRGTTKRFY